MELFSSFCRYCFDLLLKCNIMKDIVFHESDLRWTNRSSFVQYIQWAKKSDFCVLTLSYNNIQNTQWIIDRFTHESWSNLIDLIIIDNSIEEQYNNLKHHKCNVTYIRPNKNLWSAWGYALGMEYIIDQWYNYFCMIEDDIILVDNETFTDTYNARQKDRVIFINSCLNTWWDHSWYVQYACYPVKFIKKIWIIDARYFFRSEDLEWRIRIEQWLKKHNYHKFILNKNYYHPYLKKVNGSAAWSYFALRNQLFMLQQYFSLRAYLIMSITIFVYLWNGCARSMFLSQSQYLMATMYALYDFAMWDQWLQVSQFRSMQFSQKYTIWVCEQQVSIYYLINKFKLSLLFGSYMFSSIDVAKLQKFKWFHGSSVLIWWWNVILYPIFVFSPFIISIDEFVLGTNDVIISQHLNSYSLLKWLGSLLIALLLLPLYILISIFLLIKLIVSWRLNVH